MNSSQLLLLAVAAVAPACGASGSGAPLGTGAAIDAAGPESGSTGGGNPSGGSSTGGGSGGSASGASSGGSSGSSSSGSATDASSGSSDDGGGGLIFDGGVNTVPAGYIGTPFIPNTIPGFVYAANYDKGGAGVAYCHGATTTAAAACATGIHLNDWCCSATGGSTTNARCDDRDQHLGPCPIYRQNDDNAGLSHMNLGEVDTYAAAGPTWVAGPNGPTLTGPMVTVGTPVPQHANSTTQDDAYIGYMATGEWLKYTVQVAAAGTYSIGGLMGVPPGTTITLDFGNGVATGPIGLPASPVTAACKCAEAYHAWNSVANVGKVTFPAAGTYLMTLNLTKLQFNPLYFTFTKM